MKKWMVNGVFTALTDDEVKALAPDALADYTSDKMIADFNSKIENATKGFLKSEEITAIKNDFEKSLKNMPLEALKDYEKTIEDLKKESKSALELATEIKEIVNTQGGLIKAMSENGIQIPDARKKLTRSEHMKALIDRAFKSQDFADYENKGFSGPTSKVSLDNDEKGNIELVKTVSGSSSDKSIAKAVVPINPNHTGTVMISQVSDIVRDDAPARKMHVRDLLNVGMTNQAQVVAGQVYDFKDSLTLGAIMLSENGQAPESVFKSKENTWGLKRIANSMRISKRWFKTNGLQWVIDHVIAKLPDATYTVEDFQLLFGDGLGNNVDGLSKQAQPFNLVPNTYIATNFLNVATYNGGLQALITFNIPHGMKNGDSLTIAAATNAGYNATHESIEVVNATQVVIDEAYVAETLGQVAVWTGIGASIFYQAIDSAQEVDVLSVARALLVAGEFNATGHIVNPQQKIQMGLLKATDDNYLNIQKDANGEVVSVGGLPLASTTAMPTGKFMSGDFSRNGAELLEYTPLSIQFYEDVQTGQSNEIVLVIEEEIIFPVYNPYWFIYGKFSTAKTQLETP
jgi:hypothetical protein